jgi:hypothetical protein
MCYSSKYSVDKHYHQSPYAYDVEVEVPDEAGRQRLRNLLLNTASQKEITALDEQASEPQIIYNLVK